MIIDGSPQTSGAFVGGLSGAALIGVANFFLSPYPTLRSAFLYLSPLFAIWATAAYAAFIIWLRGRVERRDIRARIDRFRAFVLDVEKAGTASTEHSASLRRTLEELERLYAKLELSAADQLSVTLSILDMTVKDFDPDNPKPLSEQNVGRKSASTARTRRKKPMSSVESDSET